MTSARDIALALGGRRAQRCGDGSFLTCCPVPTHGRGHGDRCPSLAIRDGDTRVLVKCFGGCAAPDVLAELRRRGLLGDVRAVAKAQAQRRKVDHAAEQHRKAAWLWSQRRPIAGSPAEAYLRTRDYTGPLPPTLAFLPSRKPDHNHAMIAAFAVVGEAEPGVLAEPRNVESVHLTLLRPDGNDKAAIDKPKLIVGSPCAQPITLAPPNDLLGLAITEGIEDALSVHAATGLGAWAAGAATFMPALADAVPTYIDCITIYAHADEAGQRGATGLAERLHQRGFEVFIERPSWRRPRQTSTMSCARTDRKASAAVTITQRDTKAVIAATIPMTGGKSQPEERISEPCASTRSHTSFPTLSLMKALP
jgi:hypothetical protein